MNRFRAFSKLTLSLRVLGKRPDGFHELDALTVSVSEPHDELSIELGGGGFHLRVEHRDDTTPISDGPDNLALRAAHAWYARAGGARPLDGHGSGVRIELHKHIPIGAGLGGGSADAAAVLVGLDRLFGLRTSVDDLAALGATLGSDVPFCVRGGAAHMRGRGERIEPTTVPTTYVVVAVPRFALATPHVYAAWDELGGPVSSRIVEGPAGLGPLSNDLEPAAMRVEPGLAGFRAALEEAAGTPAVLAGSGSAYAVLCESADAALAARERVRGAGITRLCVAGVTCPTGVEPL